MGPTGPTGAAVGGSVTPSVCVWLAAVVTASRHLSRRRTCTHASGFALNRAQGMEEVRRHEGCCWASMLRTAKSAAFVSIVFLLLHCGSEAAPGEDTTSTEQDMSTVIHTTYGITTFGGPGDYQTLACTNQNSSEERPAVVRRVLAALRVRRAPEDHDCLRQVRRRAHGRRRPRYIRREPRRRRGARLFSGGDEVPVRHQRWPWLQRSARPPGPLQRDRGEDHAAARALRWVRVRFGFGFRFRFRFRIRVGVGG